METVSILDKHAQLGLFSRTLLVYQSLLGLLDFIASEATRVHLTQFTLAENHLGVIPNLLVSRVELWLNLDHLLW